MKNEIDPALVYPAPSIAQLKQWIPRVDRPVDEHQFTFAERHRPAKSSYPPGYPNGPTFMVFLCMPELGYCSMFERSGHFHSCAVGRSQRAMHDPGDEHAAPRMFCVPGPSTPATAGVEAPQEDEG